MLIPRTRSKRPGIFSILLAACAAALGALPATETSAADVYPNRPIRLIIPQPPGGGTDIIGRMLVPRLSDRLGRQVVVDNRGGAGTIIGTDMVAKASPDGYTLLLAPASFAVTAALQELPYDPVKSFAPIVKMADAMNIVMVHPNVPAKSLKEFVAVAKQKPGQLMFASQSSGSQVHLAIELFKMVAGVDVLIVHFKGGNLPIIDLLGGHSHATIGTVLLGLPHIKAGKLRPIGALAAKRSVLLPDVATAAESGLAGAESGTWWGFMAPAGTPATIIDRLNKEVREILASDDIQKLFLTQGVEADYRGSTEFAAFVRAEIARWGSVVKKANIKLER